MAADATDEIARQPLDRLARVLSTPLLTLYGLGVTIGAGIYVLVGVAAGLAGLYAPVSFLMAAVVVALVAFSYAEFAVRFPVSAGEAAYVRAGFRSGGLALLVGLMVALTGIVSAAAISIGAVGYLTVWIGPWLDLPPGFLTTAVVVVLGLAAAKGIAESVSLAALFTLIEIGGLLFAIWHGLAAHPEALRDLPDLLPPLAGAGAAADWGGILAASLIAFFAFIGFEDMVNVAEEVKRPERTFPRAITLTLIVTTVIYVSVVAVVVLAVPSDRLEGDRPALALLFGDDTVAVGVFTSIAVFATLNGVLIQMIMASRVLYGLAAQDAIKGALSRQLARVNPRTRTPLVATGIVVAAILLLALTLPIVALAEWTSRVVLATFALVTLALILLKLRERRTRPRAQRPGFAVPLWVPILALTACVGLIVTGFI